MDQAVLIRRADRLTHNLNSWASGSFQTTEAVDKEIAYPNNLFSRPAGPEYPKAAWHGRN
jgi:hypothetical protein